MTDRFATIILAAGMGKRMKSDLPKVLHPLAGRPLVHHVIDLARSVGSERIILVIGHGRQLVIDATHGLEVEYAVQEKQLGTGDAVNSCNAMLGSFDGQVLILSGDVPLMRAETVREAFDLHKSSKAAVTVFTFIPESAQGYGRIIRGTKRELLGIVEHKDATPAELQINEVNGGVYFFDSKALFSALGEIGNDNAAGEYYITDTVSILRRKGLAAAAYLVKDPLELDGVNTIDQLKTLESEWFRRQGTSKGS